ncbi:hypothetical protein AYL99_02573 [Fonsecaea erecta]|uniref:Uncharacterized protein n=1 Tax=Fonsecaea erecta TaxID=1367422 RepID=A0A178ZV87_9EURO|nr:hypothetical protein AYL99_02573 [Fonsecaea erecta]OAP63346.1 hypothetical protein AYL99_02573 [Fonsecaea erecta]
MDPFATLCFSVPSAWRPITKIINTSEYLLYEVAADGDAYLAVFTTLGSRVLIRVSSQALCKTTEFFKAQFHTNWMPPSSKFTPQNPLPFAEKFDEFVTFLHIASEDESIPEVPINILRPVAVLLDKYLFKGKLPGWCEKVLTSCFPLHFPFYNSVDYFLADFEISGGILDETSLPAVLHSAYLLDLPFVFATASRRMMWQMATDDVECLFPKDLQALLPMDFVGGFKEEAVRLRDDLVSHLPQVFQPDVHGGTKWWCNQCNMVPHKERWLREIIRKSNSFQQEQREGPTGRLCDLFEEYVRDACLLGSTRELEDTAFECGRFRLRYSDIGDSEILFDVYASIGGLCLPCLKAGEEIKYRYVCSKHCLFLNKE